MQQRTLPLWQADNSTTFTQLKAFCQKEYPKRGPELVKQVMDSLKLYEEAETTTLMFKALLWLNSVALELSALNPIWDDFSGIVFEATLVSVNPENARGKKAIRASFEKTIQKAALPQ